MTEKLEVRPCVNAAGNIVYYDLCPPLEEGATGGPVVASVYSGEEVANQLAAAWNTRTPPPADSGVVEALMAADVVIKYAAERLWNGRPDAIGQRPQVIDEALRKFRAALGKAHS